MYIPDDKVDEVRSASDIEEIVGDYVRLKRRGSNLFGLCPFHNEKSPSFSVNPSMGIFKCFGCGAGGDVFQFLMRLENLTFPESVRTLADRAGVPLPEDDGPSEDASEAESIYGALRFAARHFYEQLTRSEEGQPALTYLRERGFTAETIKKFGLGFAPEAWDGLLKAAEAAHISAEVLEKAGLIIPRKKGDGYYDRYRGRVIFPIFSHVGKVLGFGGRVLLQGDDQPKYINSPQTKVYDKSRVLYGLYQGKQALRRSEEVLLVEGYTDVLALHQAGVQNAVASSGTALTGEQVKALSRFVRRVILLYDADAAGAGAALRGIDMVLAQGLAAYAIALPPGDDPDAFVREHGAEGFATYVEKHRQDFVAFKYDQARRAGALETPEGQAEAMHDVVATIARIPDPLVRETYLRHASGVLGVYEKDLRDDMERALRGERRREQRQARRHSPPPAAAPPPTALGDAPPPGWLQEGPPPDDRFMPAEAHEDHAPPSARPEPLPEEKALIRVMLEQGAPLVEYILGNMGLEEFTEGPARDCVKAFLQLYEQEAVDRQRFFDGTFSDAVRQLAAEVITDRVEPSETGWKKRNISVPRLNEDPYEAAASAMTFLKLDRLEEVRQAVQKQLFSTPVEEVEALQALQKQWHELHDLRQRIERREFLEWNDG